MGKKNFFLGLYYIKKKIERITMLDWLTGYIKQAILGIVYFFILILLLHYSVYKSVVMKGLDSSFSPFLSTLFAIVAVCGVFVVLKILLSSLYSCSRKQISQDSAGNPIYESYGTFLFRQIQTNITFAFPYFIYYAGLAVLVFTPILLMNPIGRIWAGNLGKVILAILLSSSFLFQPC